MQRKTNRLSAEKSPYLRQHASNPVDWFPWGTDAFGKARAENKPIFLSVGYSTCHWCHVMAHESFEDAGIAALLNERFVCIKVDREERPDLDRVYMAYVQRATGSGGWPLSVWLTPELTPFMGGTYFPPEDRWGRVGFGTVLERIAEAWATERPRIEAAAAAVLEALREEENILLSGASGGINPDATERAVRFFAAGYDRRYGGFGDAPKFPRPGVPDLLLRQAASTPAKAVLQPMVLHTLRAMARGGIYDQLGGGFHRYAVDERWHVPHFEKMLYDQAQLVTTYLEAYQQTGERFCARIAGETLDYILRDLGGPEGELLAAEDADSRCPDRSGESVEGAFYVWTRDALVQCLGEAAAAVFCARYGVEPGGNVRDDPQGEFAGRNVLYVACDTPDVAERVGWPVGDVRNTLAQCRAALLSARAERPRPARDSKVITAWNGLAISAFARADQVLERRDFGVAARRAADFLRSRLYASDRGHLWRRWCDGEAAVEAGLDDHACLIRGLLDLYETLFDPADLDWAIALQEQQDRRFWDADGGGYFATSGSDPSVLLRLKDVHDGAEPSGNSLAVMNLLRLHGLTGNPAYRDRAERTLAAFAAAVNRAPHALPVLLAAFEASRSRWLTVVIVGARHDPSVQALLRAVRAPFRPDKSVLWVDGQGGGPVRAAPFAASLPPVDQRATAYVCEGTACRTPTTDAGELEQVLRSR